MQGKLDSGAAPPRARPDDQEVLPAKQELCVLISPEPGFDLFGLVWVKAIYLLLSLTTKQPQVPPCLNRRFISQVTKMVTNLSSMFHLMKFIVSSRLPLGRSKECTGRWLSK